MQTAKPSANGTPTFFNRLLSQTPDFNIKGVDPATIKTVIEYVSRGTADFSDPTRAHELYQASLILGFEPLRVSSSLFTSLDMCVLQAKCAEHFKATEISPRVLITAIEHDDQDVSNHLKQTLPPQQVLNLLLSPDIMQLLKSETALYSKIATTLRA